MDRQCAIHASASDFEQALLDLPLSGAVYVSRETLRGYTKPRETI